MKILATVLAIMSSARVIAASLEDCSPHFSTNTEIIWKVPADDLPKRLWIYRKSRHVFSATTISNAIVLAGFQQKGFPKGKTKTLIWADHMEGEPRPPSFLILPENGTIQYDVGDRWSNSLQDLLSGQKEVEDAWNCLGWLGVDRTQFVKTNTATHGVFFPRQIDGIRFHDDSEGFFIPTIQERTEHTQLYHYPSQPSPCERGGDRHLGPNHSLYSRFQNAIGPKRARGRLLWESPTAGHGQEAHDYASDTVLQRGEIWRNASGERTPKNCSATGAIGGQCHF